MKKYLWGGMCILLSFLLAASPARADSLDDEQVRSLIAKAFNEGLEPSERKFLIENHPEVAAQIPDPENVASVNVAGTSGDQLDFLGVKTSAKRSRVKCSTYYGWNTFKSLLGTHLYRFRQSAYVCSNGSTVTRHDNPKYRVYERAATIDDVEVRQLWVDGVGRWESESYVELRVSHCIVKYGCYGASAPTGEITARGDNTARINTYFS